MAKVRKHHNFTIRTEFRMIVQYSDPGLRNSRPYPLNKAEKNKR